MKHKFFDKLIDYSKISIIEELKRIAKLLDKQTISRGDLDTHGKVSYYTIKRKFPGGLTAALKEAGLEYKVDNRFQDDVVLLKELQRIWEIVLQKEGRRPYQTDLRKYGCNFSISTYKERFGTWLKACQTLLDWEEGQQVKSQYRERSIANSEQSTKQKDIIREISLRLRMQVFKRDNFKCVYCGRSPATHVGLVLHVDHVIPWAKGGKTSLENLQTLCQECNLGKGAST
jgi:hypothetical protein